MGSVQRIPAQLLNGMLSNISSSAITPTDVSTSLRLTLFGILAFAVVVLLTKSTTESEVYFWKTQPYAGVKKQPLSWLQATVRSVFICKRSVDEGYFKYSQRNSIFITPSIDRGAFVVVPPAQLRKIYGLPENQLDAHMSQAETIQANYTVGDPEMFRVPFHVNVLRNQITRHIPFLTPAIAEELGIGLNHYWGSSREWKTVKAWPTLLKIVSGAVNRVFCGPPYCRDDKLLEDMRQHAQWLFSNATAINALPSILKPIYGGVIKLYGPRIRANALRPLMPLINDRLEKFSERKRTGASDSDTPKDALQWLIEEAEKTGDPKQLLPHLIGHRLLLLNFVSTHSTSLTMTNVFLDLLSSKDADIVIEDLREECSRVLAESGGIWTKEVVERLVLVDSAIRESMRMSSFSVLALPRRVVAPGGIEIEDKVNIPNGMPVAVPMDAIHLDDAYYPDPHRYHAFRFCSVARIAETKLAVNYAKLAKGESNLNSKQKLASTLDDRFLTFGYGKHACPGRFFAVHEMKILFATVLMNYDMQRFDKRPEQKRITWVQLPREEVELQIRHRA